VSSPHLLLGRAATEKVGHFSVFRETAGIALESQKEILDIRRDAGQKIDEKEIRTPALSNHGITGVMLNQGRTLTWRLRPLSLGWGTGQIR
jgi:hypothetical protein